MEYNENREKVHIDASVPVLDARLSLVASFVRRGVTIVDVGTDHAYLPIWLLCTGVCPRAVVTDINKAPLQSAKDHAAKYGVADRMAFFCTDGISGVDLPIGDRTDIAICGMGGEMIADILAAAPCTRKSTVRCILQPMSSVEDLRRYLAAAGYRIEEERLATAAGKVYTCLSVIYDGVRRTPSPIEILLGEAHIRRGMAAGDIFRLYLLREHRALLKKYSGRRAGGLDTAAEEELLLAIEAIAAEAGVLLPNKNEMKPNEDK